MDLMAQAFYLPNEEELRQAAMQANCALPCPPIPICFRRDFLPDFDDLPMRFFPYDDQRLSSL